MTRRRSSSRSPKTARAGRRPPGTLRIIGGEHRRRQLPVLDHPGLRPTPDRVRETLFNWLGGTLHGARVLDLFAGTGALGLEALSRGGREAIFVEQDARVAAQLERNLATLRIPTGTVVTGEARAFLAGPSTSFSLVFLDPPFRQGLAAPCCAALEEAGWLTEQAFVYVETETALAPVVPPTWQLHREVRAGDSTGRLYHRQASASPDTDAC